MPRWRTKLCSWRPCRPPLVELGVGGGDPGGARIEPPDTPENRLEAAVTEFADLRERRKKARAGGTIPVGPLTAKKTGDLSESYGGGSSSKSAREDSLRSTSYGAKYLELQKKQITGPLIT